MAYIADDTDNCAPFHMVIVSVHSTAKRVPIGKISFCECLIDDDPIVGLQSVRVGKEPPGEQWYGHRRKILRRYPPPFDELIFLVCVSFNLEQIHSFRIAQRQSVDSGDGLHRGNQGKAMSRLTVAIAPRISPDEICRSICGISISAGHAR